MKLRRGFCLSSLRSRRRSHTGHTGGKHLRKRAQNGQSTDRDHGWTRMNAERRPEARDRGG